MSLLSYLPDDLCAYILVDWMSHYKDLVAFDIACCNRVLRCRFLRWFELGKAPQMFLDLNVIPQCWMLSRRIVLRNVSTCSRVLQRRETLLRQSSFTIQRMVLYLDKHMVDIIELLKYYPHLRQLTIASKRQSFIISPNTLSMSTQYTHLSLKILRFENLTFPGFVWMDIMICFAKYCPLLHTIQFDDCDLIPIEVLLFLTRKSFFPELQHLLFKSYEDNIVGEDSEHHTQRLMLFEQKIAEHLVPQPLQKSFTLFTYDPAHYVNLISFIILPYYKPTDELCFFPLFTQILFHVMEYACGSIDTLEVFCFNFFFQEHMSRWEAIIRKNWHNLRVLKCYYSFFFTNRVMKAIQDTCQQLQTIHWDTCQAPTAMDYDEQRLALTGKGSLTLCVFTQLRSLMIHGEILCSIHHQMTRFLPLLQRLQSLDIQNGNYIWICKDIQNMLQACENLTSFKFKHPFSIHQPQTVTIFQTICNYANPQLLSLVFQATPTFSASTTHSHNCADDIITEADVVLQPCLLKFPSIESLILHGIPISTMFLQRIVYSCPCLREVDIHSELGEIDMSLVPFVDLKHLQRLHLTAPCIVCPMLTLGDLLHNSCIIKKLCLKAFKSNGNDTASYQQMYSSVKENVTKDEIAYLQQLYHLRLHDFVISL